MWIVDTTSDHFQIWLGNDYCTELRSQWVLNWIAENNNPATWIARNIYRHLALCVQSNLPGLERPMQPPFHCPVRQQTLRWWTGSPARRPTHPELSLSFGCFEKPRPKGLQGTTRCCVWEYRNCDIGIMWNHRIYIYLYISKVFTIEAYWSCIQQHQDETTILAVLLATIMVNKIPKLVFSSKPLASPPNLGSPQATTVASAVRAAKAASVAWIFRTWLRWLRCSASTEVTPP